MKDKLQAKNGRDHDSKESKTTMKKKKKKKTKRNSSVIKDKNISSALERKTFRASVKTLKSQKMYVLEKKMRKTT